MLNDWDYSEDDWAKTDETQFTDVSDFDDSETASATLSGNSSYSVRDDSSWEPEKEGNVSYCHEEDMTNLNNLESELSEPTEELLEITSGSKENLRQSSQTQAPQMLYLGQFTYDSIPISSKLLDIPKHLDGNSDTKDTSSNLTQFTSTHISQSHIYMVQTPKILATNIANKDNDEPGTLKQAIHFSN